MNLIQNATRNKIQNAATDGNIFVNDIPVKSNYKVKPDDVIRVMLEHPPYEHLLKGENIPIDIVYEDDQLLVVNKPAGMVVHPGHGNYSGTLVNALAFHFDNLPMNSSERPGLVHRIDKDTSGLLVVAKTESLTRLCSSGELWAYLIQKTGLEKATIKEFVYSVLFNDSEVIDENELPVHIKKAYVELIKTPEISDFIQSREDYLIYNFNDSTTDAFNNKLIGKNNQKFNK